MDKMNINEDVIFSLLRSQVNVLSDVLRSLEEKKGKPLIRNNRLNEYIQENIKNMDQNLRWQDFVKNS